MVLFSFFFFAEVLQNCSLFVCVDKILQAMGCQTPFKATASHLHTKQPLLHGSCWIYMSIDFDIADMGAFLSTLCLIASRSFGLAYRLHMK